MNHYLIYFCGEGYERESCLVFGAMLVIADTQKEAWDKFKNKNPGLDYKDYKLLKLEPIC